MPTDPLRWLLLQGSVKTKAQSTTHPVLNDIRIPSGKMTGTSGITSPAFRSCWDEDRVQPAEATAESSVSSLTLRSVFKAMGSGCGANAWNCIGWHTVALTVAGSRDLEVAGTVTGVSAMWGHI